MRTATMRWSRATSISLPLIASSTTLMTSDSWRRLQKCWAREFRDLVCDEFAKNAIPFYYWFLPTGQVDPEINACINNEKPVPTFTLINDNKMEREYEWGTCKLEDRNASDLMLLKDLVIKEHLELMRKKAYVTYDKDYRTPHDSPECVEVIVNPNLGRENLPIFFEPFSNWKA